MIEDDDIQDYKKPWVGLTEEEAQKIDNRYDWTKTAGRMLAYKAIEAKLKEKNT